MATLIKAPKSVTTTRTPKTAGGPSNSRIQIIGIPVLIIAILVIWETSIQLLDIRSVILPRPIEVWNALLDGLLVSPNSPEGLYRHTGMTLTAVLSGYAIGVSIGFLLALLLSQVRAAELIVRPLLVAFESVPKIAFAPLFIVWFGFGLESKIALVAIVTFFPVLVNGLVGFKSVEEDRREMMRSMRASRWQSFTKLSLPGSLPFLFAGLEVSLVQAMTATIVAEFLSGTAGLGNLIVQNQQILDTASIFAILVVLGIIGWFLVRTLGQLKKRLVFWTPDMREAR